MKKIFFIALWVVVYTINTNAQISSNLPSVLNYSILNPAASGLEKTTISLFYGTPFSGVIGSPKVKFFIIKKNITKLLVQLLVLKIIRQDQAHLLIFYYRTLIY